MLQTTNPSPSTEPDTTIDGVKITTANHDNDVIVATAKFLNFTYKYLFSPRAEYNVTEGYSLSKFSVNNHTYNQQSVGDTDLPGERAATERTFYHLSNEYNTSFTVDSLGNTVSANLSVITPDKFTPIGTDNINTDISLTLDGVDDKSGVTLSPTDTIYDLYTDEFYEVGIPHNRGRGAIGRALEIRKQQDDEFIEHNIRHIDLKIHRGRWQCNISPTTGITDIPVYETDSGIVSTDDVLTGFGSFPGLTDNSTFRITRLTSIQGHGIYAVLTPETSINAFNELNVRAYPADDIVHLK